MKDGTREITTKGSEQKGGGKAKCRRRRKEETRLKEKGRRIEARTRKSKGKGEGKENWVGIRQNDGERKEQAGGREGRRREDGKRKREMWNVRRKGKCERK